jgi:hypothetical protein
MATIKKDKRKKIISTSGAVEKLEPLCTIGGNVKWFSHYGKSYGASSKK